ncbi:MAG: 50S ribosomal protein L18 [Patescibacteria group bacterium]
MDKNKIKIEKRTRRHKKIRSRVSGTAAVPRLSVFRSNSYVYAQLIDDENQKTLASVSSMVAEKGKSTLNKTAASLEAGKTLAKEALAKKIKKVVFDRGGFIYTGRIKALADGAREGGLDF